MHCRPITGVALIALTAASPPIKIALPDSEAAVTMAAPVLPARIAGDCPGPDPCEFNTRWRACEPVPLYREAHEGATVVRHLKADETFTAKGALIELVAPGEVEMLASSTSGQTGGLVLAKGSKLAVYGPLQRSRALFYDPASGKGWSPAAASDDFWRDDKLARMVRTPTMTWWVQATLRDGTSGWLQFKMVPGSNYFPVFEQAEAVITWDIDKLRDDESPDCGGLLEIREEARRKLRH